MSALASIVQAGGGEVASLLDRIERRMLELCSSHGEVLGRLAGETVGAGGKRLRPLLVCLAAGVPPPESEEVVRAAVAVELVHAASLVHDDVLDRAGLRRGRPTVVAIAGRRGATATGDLLFSRAFAELAAGGDGSLESVRILARASAELASGELIQREDAWRADVGIERYLERCRLKTAVLFAAACELGALSGARGEAAGSLAAFGERIGVAFQILDDILDVAGQFERTGKPRGTDLLDGTVTLPLIIARRGDRELAELDLRSVRTPERAAEVCERIAGSGSLELARERALAIVERARAGLPELPEQQRAALELVARGVVERYS